MDSSSIPSLGETGQFLVSMAKIRWLFPEEIFILLTYDPAEYGLEVMKSAVNTPMNGQLYIFSANGSTKYDTVSWAKKKSQGRIQETYMNLKINGSEMIRGIYCKAGDNANFRRRIYRLIRNDLTPKQICIVHYRTCTDDEKPERPILNPHISYLLNKQMLPRSVGYTGYDQQTPSLLQQPSTNHAQILHHQNAISSGPTNPQVGGSNMNEDFDDLLNELLQSDGDIMDVQQHDQLYDGQSQSSYLHQYSFPHNHNTSETVIVDFAPDTISFSTESGGSATKILLCLNDQCCVDPIKLILSCLSSGDYHEFYPDRISSSVLRLMLPPINAGSWCISLLTQNNQVLTNDCTQFINVVYDIPIAVKSEQIKLGKRHLNHPSPKVRDRKSLEASQLCHNSDISSETVTTFPLLPPGITTGATSFPHQVPDSVVDREYKIRIVEKLGSVKSALLHDENDHPNLSFAPAISSSEATATNSNPLIHSSQSNDDHDGGMVWLDEVEVSKMSNAELELAMDRYITTIMQELVNFAAFDDDLKAEINSLDPIARGAEVNQRTSSGSTPLHLAVAAGHMGAAGALLSNGADMFAVDANSLTAVEIAKHSSFEHIENLLVTAGAASPIQYYSPHRGASSPMVGMTSPETTINSNSSVIQSADRSDKDPSKLLHKVFASLSLTDKCALSISMKHVANNAGGTNNVSSTSVYNNTPRSFPNVPSMAPNNIVIEGGDPGSSTEFGRLPCNTLHPSSSNNSISSMNLLMGASQLQGGVVNLSGKNHSNSLSNNEEDISDIQSVLSFQDNESLEKAMSLMGDYELQQVEEEVRKIQNNVRGWILRKNYVNLREAAKVLQTAWREKKKGTGSSSTNNLSPSLSSHAASSHHHPSEVIGFDDDHSSSGPATSRSSHSDPRLSEASHDQNFMVSYHGVEMNEAEAMDRAAATLQAATRRMIARKSFSSIRKQTMASLVIQKNLLKWWVNNKHNNPVDTHSFQNHFN